MVEKQSQFIGKNDFLVITVIFFAELHTDISLPTNLY